MRGTLSFNRLDAEDPAASFACLLRAALLRLSSTGEKCSSSSDSAPSGYPPRRVSNHSKSQVKSILQYTAQDSDVSSIQTTNRQVGHLTDRTTTCQRCSNEIKCDLAYCRAMVSKSLARTMEKCRRWALLPNRRVSLRRPLSS